MSINGETHSVGPAIQAFREKITTANRAFLNDRIDEIQKFDLPEPKKLQIAAHFWSKSVVWPFKKRDYDYQTGYILDGKALEEQRERENKVTSVEEVRTLWHPYFDGVKEPTLTDEKWRRVFIEELENVSNEKFDLFKEDGHVIKASPELDEFLQHADGIVDMDFRYWGICGFELVPQRILTPPDEDEIDDALIHKWIRKNLEWKQFNEGEMDNLQLYDWDCKGGFETGRSKQENNWMWFSAYTYCRKTIEEGDDEKAPEHQWAWRVLFWNDAQIVGIDEQVHAFEHFDEFLEWYSSWPGMVDLDGVRENMYGDEKYPSLFGDYTWESDEEKE
ncbi:hypothetical protein MW887_003048 [Aspergillus wentii]|nr:hypothetical protein MW887_003048 [Aspergillus wentii]